MDDNRPSHLGFRTAVRHSQLINQPALHCSLPLSSWMARRYPFLPFCWASWAATPRRKRCAFTGTWTCSLRPWRTGGTASPSPWWSGKVRAPGLAYPTAHFPNQRNPFWRYYIWKNTNIPPSLSLSSTLLFYKSKI